MKMYVVKERVEYEGDNIWIVSAESREEAIELTSAVKHNHIHVDLLEWYPGDKNGIIWQN